jgi:hypothetical protein
MEEIRNSHKKPEGKKPLERHKHRWEDNIKIHLTETWCRFDSCGLAQALVVDSCEHNNESSGSIRSRKFLGLLSNYLLLKRDFASWD